MIFTQSDFHSKPFSGFRHTSSRKSPLLWVILLCPELHPFIIIIQMAPSICDAFDNTHVQYINDTLHINRSVFKPQFIHYTKYAKYAFLLLSSIPVITLCMPVDNFVTAISLLQTVWTQMKTNRVSVLIWIQTVWHSDGGPGWFIFKNLILKKVSRRK